MVQGGDACSCRYYGYELNLTLEADVGGQDGRGRWARFFLWVYRSVAPDVMDTKIGIPPAGAIEPTETTTHSSSQTEPNPDVIFPK